LTELKSILTTKLNECGIFFLHHAHQEGMSLQNLALHHKICHRVYEPQIF